MCSVPRHPLRFTKLFRPLTKYRAGPHASRIVSDSWAIFPGMPHPTPQIECMIFGPCVIRSTSTGRTWWPLRRTYVAAIGLMNPIIFPSAHSDPAGIVPTRRNRTTLRQSGRSINALSTSHTVPSPPMMTRVGNCSTSSGRMGGSAAGLPLMMSRACPPYLVKTDVRFTRARRKRGAVRLNISIPFLCPEVGFTIASTPPRFPSGHTVDARA
mmetsp:Transcript_753/g.1726  ORF Transcript_753/g.1726 Transcript_753/m.1726 type:complete len:212 (-) Transcript_753:348-983(-)